MSRDAYDQPEERSPLAVASSDCCRFSISQCMFRLTSPPSCRTFGIGVEITVNTAQTSCAVVGLSRTRSAAARSVMLGSFAFIEQVKSSGIPLDLY
jgi:hypothetical protein